MKWAVIIIMCCVLDHSADGQPSRRLVVNPTGTYILKGHRQQGEIKGNFAEIRVKLLSDSLMALTLYCNKGYPDYASACLTDTLLYSDNAATHSSTSDATCQLQFMFDMEGVYIKRILTDPYSTCGFGKGVLPIGYVKKYSSAVPIIQRLSRQP